MTPALLPDTSGTPAALPHYRSHKEVSAVAITAVEPRISGGALLHLDGFAPFEADAKLVHRYMPIGGDFLVIYSDGYRSISPRHAFESGYTRIA